MYTTAVCICHTDPRVETKLSEGLLASEPAADKQRFNIHFFVMFPAFLHGETRNLFIR